MRLFLSEEEEEVGGSTLRRPSSNHKGQHLKPSVAFLVFCMSEKEEKEEEEEGGTLRRARQA